MENAAMPRTLFMIAEEHTDSAGRQKARELVESRQIAVFFMEWATPIDRENIPRSFIGLNPADAPPTLEELAQSCVDNGIAAVACDLSVEATLARLNAPPSAPGEYKESSVFQPWGQAVRDKYAAETIAAYLEEHFDVQSALLMFGADHFFPKNLADRDGTPALGDLVQAALPDWNCKFV
jgi:hypothetical protein